jgi:hypothetical protein
MKSPTFQINVLKIKTSSAELQTQLRTDEKRNDKHDRTINRRSTLLWVKHNTSAEPAIMIIHDLRAGEKK